MRLSVVIAVACISMVGLSAAGEASAAVRRHTFIASQGLGPALQQLASERDVQFVYRSEVVGDRQTAGASGDLTFEEALTKLLEGTGLTYQFLGERAITLILLPNSTSQLEQLGAPFDETRYRATPMAESQRPYGATRSGGAGQPVDLWSRFRLAQVDQERESGGAAAANSEPRPAGRSAAQLEEILVTAQKREERLQEVPVPVTAISGESLTDNNQLRLQDYYAKIPGVSLTVAGNGNEPVVIIRGVTTGTESNPTAGIVIDDVPYGGSVYTGGGPYAPDIDPGDLDHVEVLRGPQGTLYGASSMGGLLKFVTVAPTTDGWSGRLQLGSTSVSKSDDFGYSVRGAFNAPISNTFAVRLSGFIVDDPGYVDNAESGQDDVNSRESDGARMSALWQPSAAFSLTLSALVQNSERGGSDDVDTLLGKDPKQAFLSGTGIYDRDTTAYSATMVGQLGSVELTSITGYSVDDVFDNVDSSKWFGGFLASLATFVYGPGVDRAVTLVNTNLEKFTQELRAAFSIGERVDLLLGAFYTDEDALNAFINNAASSTDPNAGLLLANVNPTAFEEYAAFTNLTISATDRFDIQIGGRYSENKQSSSSINSGPLAGFLCNGEPSCTISLPKTQDSAFTYLVTPRLKVSPDLMLYARFASGYRPGGPNASCGAPGVPCSFEPDTTQNYDIGVKGTALNGRVAFDAAIYYIDWKDIQIPGQLSGFFAFTDNVSEAKSQGVEISAEWRSVSGLTLSGWAAYNDAELTEAFPSGSLSGSPGDRLPYSSRFSGNLALEQEFPLQSDATAFVGGSLSYVGDRKGQFQPTAERETFPSYTQLDANVGVRFGTWTVHAFVNNITDERGVLRGGMDAVVSDVSTNFAYIQPRTIGITISKTF